MAGLAAAASEPLSGHSALGGSRGALGAWQEAAGAPLPWQRPAGCGLRGGEERSPEWEGAERGVGPRCGATAARWLCDHWPARLQPAPSPPHLGREDAGAVCASALQTDRSRTRAAAAAGAPRRSVTETQGGSAGPRSPSTGSAGALAGETAEKGQQENPRSPRSPRRPPALHNDRPDGPLSSPVPRPQPRGRSGAGERECGCKSQTGDKWRPGARSAGLGTLMFCRWEWSVPVTLDPRLSRPLEGR